MIKVFETKARKWVKVDDKVNIVYTENSHEATRFSIGELISANIWFTDFNLYNKTMLAVPDGSNIDLYDHSSVTKYINDFRNRQSEVC